MLTLFSLFGFFAVMCGVTSDAKRDAGPKWRAVFGGLAALAAGATLYVTINGGSHPGTIGAALDGATTSVDIPLLEAVLVPGVEIPGEWPETANPGTQGSPTSHGYEQSEMPIGRWNVRPFQTFSGNFKVGVVFTMSQGDGTGGMDHVAFSVNGGPWTNVTAMTVNTQTANTSGIGVNYDPSGLGAADADTGATIEYWTTLRASDFTPGYVEVRAIGYPKQGTPRVLQGDSRTGQGSLILSADPGSTLSHTVRYVATGGSGDGSTSGTPLGSINAAVASIFAADGHVEGAEILLAAGSYGISSSAFDENYTGGSTPIRGLTIRPQDGVSRSSVTITGSSGGAGGLWLHQLNILNCKLTAKVTGSTRADWTRISFEGCEFAGTDRFAGSDPFAGDSDTGWKDLINCYIHDCRGQINASLARNCKFERISVNAIPAFAAVFNCEVIDLNVGDTGFHPDVFFQDARASNCILYGCKATESIYGNSVRMHSIDRSDPTPNFKDIAVYKCNFSADVIYGIELDDHYRNFDFRDSILVNARGVHPSGVAFNWDYNVDLDPSDIFVDNVTYNGYVITGDGDLTGVTFR